MMNEQGKPATCCDNSKAPGIWRMWARSFRGPLGWTAVVACGDALLAIAVIVLAIVWLNRAETTRGMIGAAATLGAAMVVMALVKVFGWMLIFHNATADRLDRIEKRLAELGGPDDT